MLGVNENVITLELTELGRITARGAVVEGSPKAQEQKQQQGQLQRE
jgi:hypothetical protein